MLVSFAAWTEVASYLLYFNYKHIGVLHFLIEKHILIA